jgi:hypothetical protein
MVERELKDSQKAAMIQVRTVAMKPLPYSTLTSRNAHSRRNGLHFKLKSPTSTLGSVNSNPPLVYLSRPRPPLRNFKKTSTRSESPILPS